MPYIESKRREELEEVLNVMIKNGVTASTGDINYILFSYCNRIVSPVASYHAYKMYLAELNEAMHEIRRRFLVPYEDEKIKKNGDIL